jgi:hypothetical protein
MKNVFLALLACSIFLFACQPQDEINSQQSIQEIVSEDTDIQEETTTEVPVETTEEIQEVNETAEEVQPQGQAQVQETTITNEKPILNKRCRDSTILYGGCKWNDAEETTFDLKIQNAGKYTITGTWIIVTGESGGQIVMKRPEDILPVAIRTYNLNYEDLVEEVGKVKRLEVYPIETINSTEYACENMRVYTIPEAYCKPSAPMHLNDDGTLNETG